MKTSIICLLLLCYWCNCELKDGEVYQCTSEECGKCARFRVEYDKEDGDYHTCIECNGGSVPNYKKVPSSKISNDDTLGSQGCSSSISGKGLLIALIVVLSLFCCICMFFCVYKLCSKEGTFKFKCDCSCLYNKG